MKELRKAFHGEREAMTARGKSQPEMCRLAETVAGNHQNAAFGKSPAELARVGAVRQPRKSCHPSARSSPVQEAVVLGEKPVVALSHYQPNKYSGRLQQLTSRLRVSV